MAAETPRRQVIVIGENTRSPDFLKDTSVGRYVDNVRDRFKKAGEIKVFREEDERSIVFVSVSPKVPITDLSLLFNMTPSNPNMKIDEAPYRWPATVNLLDRGAQDLDNE